MTGQDRHGRGAESIVESASGTACPEEDCTGTLSRGTYRGDLALVCWTCGTPRVRVW